ncbi:ABC transporter ATP-binding protein [Planomicrobium sp. YIM 101495]|uniref:ABC transporter ATP-binding protein n=1 Tax=Planomicrobium sp. YIM 101495 TaxID=2665160 RepID=UPI0012BA179B|nr:ABC transporter ATP-binding protein [Planomicrobium sp. YIM 101495]MTD30738.1 ATP-binding cassette domain-containing protein [Planomicrobium sp. YIM 101495]
MGDERNLLMIEQLKTYFYLDENRVAKAVDGVSLSIKPGETFALVGESGSGKSMTALSILQLINKPGKIIDGSVSLDGMELISKTDKEMSKIRGNDISMIFQEPMTALNPVFTIGDQITEILRKHKGLKKKEAHNRAVELLDIVGIPRANEIIHEYPHQLSGGMRQRVMIAMAISCEPKLLIADEPTTALDVTIQSQILDLLKEMQEKFNMAVLLITHDLGVVAEYADRVAVMYGGQIVEQTSAKQLIKEMKHPYSKGLIQSLPSFKKTQSRLDAIPGTIPPAYDFPHGCRFSARCPFVMDICTQSNPELIEAASDHHVRCFLYEEGGADIHETASPAAK